MHRRTPAFVILWAAAATTPLAAQTTLAELQTRFRAETQALAARSPSADQQMQQLATHISELRRFLGELAIGDDRWNGRLMLADLELVRGERTAAGAALRDIDAKVAPALVLVTAATMAQHLGLQAERDAFVQQALGKDAPLADRLAMARMLMTVLQDPQRGEQVFAAALAGARDDEQRGFVRWHRADALRDREDLPENAAFDELQKLADELPNTYWGSVAKDRLRATRIQIGDPAIDFHVRTLDGQDWTLRRQRQKPVVLAFWSAADYDTPRLIELLIDLQQKHRDLVVLGVCLDRDPQVVAAAVKQLGIPFPVVGDGKGSEGDAPLRWFVEGPVVHLVDKAGDVAALGLQAGTADGRAELTEAVQRATR